MAFVKIKKAGKGILSIPSGSLENYLRNGWELSDDSRNDSKEEPINTKAGEAKAQNEHPETSGDDADGSKDEWDEVEAEENAKDEKPIDEMSVEELQEKAKSLGINTKNFNTVGALRKAIKRAQ